MHMIRVRVVALLRVDVGNLGCPAESQEQHRELVKVRREGVPGWEGWDGNQILLARIPGSVCVPPSGTPGHSSSTGICCRYALHCHWVRNGFAIKTACLAQCGFR